MDDPLTFIAPMPRLRRDGATWVSDLRRLETLGFDTVAVSQHVTRGWQLGLVAAMTYAAASTSRLRVLSLVAQNDLHHPALLAKEIATIDTLSGEVASLRPLRLKVAELEFLLHDEQRLRRLEGEECAKTRKELATLRGHLGAAAAGGPVGAPSQ